MKPLTFIIWFTMAFYGFVFVLYHLWLRPVYRIARTGKILTASQKVAMRVFPFVTPATVISLFFFFVAIILKVIVLAIKTELH